MDTDGADAESLPSLVDHVDKSQRRAFEENQQHESHHNHRSKGGGFAQRIVGGSLIAPDGSCEKDSISVDSTSLFGASYAPSLCDQSLATRSSLPMEYSEDETSERGSRPLGPPASTSLLGGIKIGAEPSTCSVFCLDRDFDDDADSILTSSTGDIYFAQDLIPPPTLLLKTNPLLSIDVDDDESHADRISIVGSSDNDNHIYEDEDDSSNNITVEPPYEGDDGKSDGSWDRSHKDRQRNERTTAVSDLTTAHAVLDWSTYNQERGRFVAQRLIAKARQRHSNDNPTPTTPATVPSAADVGDLDDNHDSCNSFGKTFLSFRNPYARFRQYYGITKRLDQEYQVVDATIPPDATEIKVVLDEENPSPKINRNLLQGLGSRGSSLSDSLQDDDDDAPGTEDAWFPTSVASSRLESMSQGLERRATVDEIMAQFDMGLKGRSAIQELREHFSHHQKYESTTTTTAPQPPPCPCEVARGISETCLSAHQDEMLSSCRMMVSIHGIQIPDYEMRVHWIVSQYRRQVLGCSDSLYDSWHLGGRTTAK